MVKQVARKLFNTPVEIGAKVKRARSTAEARPGATGGTQAVAPKLRQIDKPREAPISVHFPTEVKASLLMVQGKTGYNLKDSLAEALRDMLKKHDVLLSVQLGEGR